MTAARVDTITQLIVIFYTLIEEHVCVVVTTTANAENQGNSSVLVQHGLEGGGYARRTGRSRGVFPSKENEGMSLPSVIVTSCLAIRTTRTTGCGLANLF